MGGNFMIKLEDYIPEEFQFSYFSSIPIYTVDFKESHLIFSKGYSLNNYSGNKVKAELSLEDWIYLFEHLDRLKIWDWRKKYNSRTVIYDGVNWYLNIKMRNKIIESSGKDAYPKNFDELLNLFYYFENKYKTS